MLLNNKSKMYVNLQMDMDMVDLMNKLVRLPMNKAAQPLSKKRDQPQMELLFILFLENVLQNTRRA